MMPGACTSGACSTPGAYGGSTLGASGGSTPGACSTPSACGGSTLGACGGATWTLGASCGPALGQL